MIPNIFVSSTISDLHYLRDGLRDAIEELCYHPVMSEHGEVGYLNPNTAAESCYRSVRQCQIVVLIVGKRYGSTGDDGLSVTHREFLGAKDEQVPIITFVEPQVLNYKDVYHADRKAHLWDAFSPMDNPRNTFQLLDAIAASDSFNAIIPFTSVGDAKKKLKLQIADFVGDRLSETVRPMGTQLRDVLAEVATVRNLLVHSSAGLQAKEEDAKRYRAVTRFLLNENVKEYRTFLGEVFGDLETAIASVPECDSFDAVLAAAGYTCETIPDKLGPDGTVDLTRGVDLSADAEAIFCSVSLRGRWAVYADKHLRVSQSILSDFDKMQKALRGVARVD